MINEALQFTCDVLDQFIKNQFGLDERKVIKNTLINSDGTVPAANQNKIVLSLINIEKESNRAFNVKSNRPDNGNYVNINPDERFNLDILVSSNFDDYSETLKFLDATILFFQLNTVFSVGTSPAIPKRIDKFELDMVKFNFQEMSELWSAMGAKYRPSVIYKIRLVTMQGFEVEKTVPGVLVANNQVTP